MVLNGCTRKSIGCGCSVHATQEQLAFKIQFEEEVDFPIIFAEPLNVVVEALERHLLWDELLQNLPDCSLESAQTIGLEVFSSRIGRHDRGLVT